MLSCKFIAMVLILSHNPVVIGGMGLEEGNICFLVYFISVLKKKKETTHNNSVTHGYTICSYFSCLGNLASLRVYVFFLFNILETSWTMKEMVILPLFACHLHVQVIEWAFSRFCLRRVRSCFVQNRGTL